MTPEELRTAQELFRAVMDAPPRTDRVAMIATALRAAESSALERAAQEADVLAASPNFAMGGIYALTLVARKIRALASPASAPAAETRSAPPSRCAHGIPMDAPCMSCPTLAPGRRASAEGPVRAPPSEPAAPEKEIANLLGRGHVENPREGEPGDAETYSSPAPLLPRVLAALEFAGDALSDERAGLHFLAAELRAYIAEREPAEKRIAELEAALRDTLNAAHHHVQAGQHWICSEPFACEEECPCAKLAARAAKAKGEGR